MDYQVKNTNNPESDSLYQSKPSIENKFLDDVLGDKINSLRETIKELEEQIKRRKEIKEINLYQINLGSCAIGTELKNLPEWTLNPVLEKKRLALEQQLIRLEKEKREEDTALWKDIQLLYKDLSEAKREYQTMISKMQSLMPKKFYSAFGIEQEEKVEVDNKQSDSAFEEMLKTALVRIP